MHLQRVEVALAAALAESARRCGGDVLQRDGLLLVAGRHPCPLIVNGALRTGSMNAATVLERAAEFFGSRRHRYELWTRDGRDADLEAAALSAGMQLAVELHAMVADSIPPLPALGPGVEICVVEDAGGVAAFTGVVAQGFEDEAPDAAGLVRSVFADPLSLLAPDTRAFVVRESGEPVAAAMTMLQAGVAWVGWVATRPGFRGRGLGRLAAAAATRAGFELGADLASLEATKMGTPVYRALGYRETSRYRNYWRVNTDAPA